MSGFNLAVTRGVGGFAGILDFDHVSPGVGLAAVEIGESIDLRKLPTRKGFAIPACDIGVCGKGRNCAAYVRRCF
ncbi:hypothetical protein D3C71_2105110 [compost metagenome]